ncbi:MAG: CoA-transferase [Halanaeroarchaeum sp.]
MSRRSLSALAAEVESGDTLAFGGKTLHRGPVAFARAIARRDVDDLHHIGLAKSIEVDLLCGTGQLNRVDFGYIGFEALGLAPNFRRAAEDGNIDVREGTCYTVATSLRAARHGTAFMPVAGLAGSDLPSVNPGLERIEFSGEDACWAVDRITPDIGVIHATVADTEGNARIEGADLTEALVARAADTVFVTAERILDPAEFRDGDTDIPGVLVDAVAEVPYGAHPCSCPGAYEYDVTHLETYLDHARDHRFDAYLHRYLGGDEADYRTSVIDGRETAIEWETGNPPDGRDDVDRTGRSDVTIAEVMTVALARRLREHETLFQGFASPLPTVSLRLARRLYGDMTHLSASGAIDGAPERMPVSTEDQHLLEGATGHFTSPEAFDLAARGGIDVMFVGGAQIDREGRLNGSVVGDYSDPTVRFGGAGGSGSLLPLVENAYAWRTEHSPRVLPESVDFVTASGNLTYLVTPRCEFERRDGELCVVSVMPGVTNRDVAEATGWDVTVADPGTVSLPTQAEYDALTAVDPTGVRRAGFEADQLRPLDRA